MNEAEKCPVCRSDGRKERGREDGEYVAYYVCDTCLFMCGLEDLPRIAAAMELARAEVAASNAVWGVPMERLEPAIEASEDMLFQAKMRVLEVFKNGQS